MADSVTKGVAAGSVPVCHVVGCFHCNYRGGFVQAIEKYADALTKKISATVHLPLELQPWTIYGIALIILIYTMPTGVAGGISSLRTRLKRA